MAWDNFPIRTRSMTPDEVLAVLAEDSRQSLDGVLRDESFVLSAAVTVHAWLDWDDVTLGPSWRHQGEWLNRRFDLDVPTRDWRAVLTPMRRRTLGDVCEFIAAWAKTPVLEAACVLGKRCETAGALLAVRELLRRRGADVSQLRPSTAVRDFAVDEWLPLRFELIRLRPDAPALRLRWEEHWGRTLTLAMYFGGVLVMLIGCVLDVFQFSGAFSPLLLGSAAALMGFVASWMTPDARVTEAAMGDLRTFRDLCEWLVKDSSPGARTA